MTSITGRLVECHAWRSRGRLRVAGLASVDVYAGDAVFHGHRLLRRPPKTIEPLLHDDIVEAQMFEKCDKLCLRQSAGDSTGPQVDIAANRF